MAKKSKRRIAVDDDIPEMQADDFARARPLREAMPGVVAAMKRGRPRLANPKARVSLRLDPEIVAAYRATGEGWQRRINDVLARAIARKKPKRAKAA